MSGSARQRAVSSASGMSGAQRPSQDPDYSTMPPPTKDLRLFDPCAATGSMFLYAQGASVVCCHHDTLTIERRFSRHTDEIQLLAVDNQSETGSGRCVVSYDAGQTAIVWDLMTGDEVSRFVSYAPLTAVAWMRNGNVAFGNSQGTVILFEPATSEHISTRTLEQIAVTSLAPGADCRTFAIGYQNGSLLIATLQPHFTILHNLSTSRAPSPIVTLAWHASSAKQKSDMLATQTHSGDLRVFSVAKAHNADEQAKVVRILKRAENFSDGQNWMGWSKNGRVIQFSESQTLSHDVRTKHVTCDNIPTLEHVRGIAVWGPGASLFTLGPNGTVQQFDLNSPSIMVANVQHPVNLLPPSPPNSIEETGNKSAHSATTIQTSASESELSSVPVEMNVSESDEDHLSPFARFNLRPTNDSGNEASYESSSPVSSRSGVSSHSRSSAGSRTPGRHAGSLRSRGMTENTYISAGSSLKSSTIGHRRDMDSYSMGYSIGSTSVPSVSSASRRHRPSRLRNEIPRSPDDNKVHDLFKYTRTRLSDIPYKRPIGADNSRLTNDDLRRQMLSTIFGWQKEVEDLIRDEMSRHPAGSTSRILLAKWLGEMSSEIMGANTENMTSSDWMLLALSGIGAQSAQYKLGRAYVQRLLETGDVHVAVTIMLGMGDHNDAIEIYISHKRYMEALILSCLSFPSVWERQVAIIRKWGEWAVQHNQQQLAIRCFACTGQESSEAWTSPSATQLNFQSITPSIPEILSPPLSPPGVQRGPQRSIAKSSALKLITSFGDQSQKSKFYSQGDDGQTPIAAGVTPIAESAISPGASFDTATALLRPSNNSRFNTPTSARPNGPNFGRGRLPSIGEIPSDLNRDALKSKKSSRGDATPTYQPSHGRKSSGEQANLLAGNALQRAATASPMMMRDQFQHTAETADLGRPPSPDSRLTAKMQDIRRNSRNGSRDRMPQGLSLDLRTDTVEMGDIEIASPEQSVGSSTRFHWPQRRRGPGSVTGSVTSNSSAGRSLRKQREDYIHSLETAHHYSKKTKNRTGSKERSGRDRSAGRNRSHERRAKSREASEDRGRASARAWNKPKRSPTSPIPMSPEDLAILSTPKFSEIGDPVTVKKLASSHRSKPSSRASSKGSRRQSPDRRPQLPPLDTRGRSKGRDGAVQRSPSSPLPLSAPIQHHFQGSDDEEDYLRALQSQEQFRAKHNRSATNALKSPVATKSERSMSRRRDTPDNRETINIPVMHGRAASTEHAGDLRRMKEERQRKKEQASRELEERRKSLAKRSLTAPILHPHEYSPDLRIGIETSEPKPLSDDLPPRSATEPPKSMFARGPHIGLPATPKAMRLILETDGTEQAQEETPNVPPIPATFAQRHTPQASPSNSPDKESGAADVALTLLPSTVYQPPVRPIIPRSMSAPILDDVDHTRSRRRPSRDDVPPPPPPPAPPMLKELAHLAMPPPPPPAPLQNAKRTNPSSAISSGMIEIVMDDDENDDVPAAMPTPSLVPAPLTVAPNDNMVPVLPPPAPPSSKGHSRGRSIGESSSMSSRFSKATDRLRSASRGRKERLKSPPVEAPYESVPTPTHTRSPHAGLQGFIPPMPVKYDPDVLRSPVEGPKPTPMSTGLHQSEMF